ncbi:predicted protein [Streptomyces pristinaespiralis ATCC 25486]|uniref:Predicted protein n=1 Tax=Streptomyces pristinaespiralis (strain ATCC 25486 / DSM 40338 / CBS 914.69 / JCM 4507 / KCC S-0507 / NBRC 13074 / NRRL 2958 / 5647) TaxID=457429 RepID=D6X619_STRE2|nr:predicted protein [Streptomyces pristinaespiralis ATCC 25486]
MTAAPTAVSPMLLRLAEERATGVLVRDHGALYLAEGQVVHAESPAAPGIEVLLTAGGRLAPEGWQEAVARAGARREVARFLVDSGQVTGGEMEICHLRTYTTRRSSPWPPEADQPGSGKTSPTGWAPCFQCTTWWSPGKHAGSAGSSTPCGRTPRWTSAPVRCRPPGHGASATPRQRALLELADGVRTPSAIARAVGRPAFNTLLEVRRMAAAGLVETPADPAAPDPAPLPAWVADFADDPDIALLRRLRDALEASL